MNEPQRPRGIIFTDKEHNSETELLKEMRKAHRDRKTAPDAYETSKRNLHDLYVRVLNRVERERRK